MATLLRSRAAWAESKIQINGKPMKINMDAI
jgi:hypothetical protein